MLAITMPIPRNYFTTRFKVEKAVLPKGTYRNINGNYATSLGLLAASEKGQS